MRSSMYQKAPSFAGNGAVKISFVACGFSPVKIDNSDYPKSFITCSRINEVFFLHKISLKHLFYDNFCEMLQQFVSLQSNLLFCWHGS